MSKTKTGATKNTSQPAAKTQTEPDSWSRTLRETVESVVIAFILAFLFRTFEAEAFVIPTGSMAPTLQGRHKDITCPKCGYEYRAGASQEVDEGGAPRPNCYLNTATCPMCFYQSKVGPGSKYPSYSGDRIIVSKFAYDLSNPERWDVIVFKYPEDSKTNYIKRLVGMPNERLKIFEGDVYTAPLGSNQFEIERKGKRPDKLLSMLQPVYDNDFAAKELLAAGFPERWQSWQSANQPPQWIADENARSFEIDGKNPAPAWLRYQNLLPTTADWEAVENKSPIKAPSPSLIGDFYAYNDGHFVGCPDHGEYPQWVGDLSLSCQLEVKSRQGAVLLELVKGGRQFRCEVDLVNGKAKLSISGLADYAPIGQTSIQGPGEYKLTLANVDEQLLLWVDGKVVTFDAPTSYPSLNNYSPNKTVPIPGNETPTDLSPIGIAALGGAAFKVSHLKIERDIYYVSQDNGRQGMNDVESPLEIGPEQFFMLGDNSPQSKDSRYWRTTMFVNRSLLIGKALFIYWPHSFDQIRIGGWKIPFPFFPNFGDMGFVR